MSKIDVIMTSYNRPTLIKDAISSIMAQTFQDWNLWIVDDSSNEETRKTIVRAILGDQRIHLQVIPVTEEERQLKMRYCVCINTALEQTHAEYVTYITDDDYYLPRRLERMAYELDTKPEAFVVYGKQQIQKRQANHWIIEGIRETVGKTRSPMCCIDHNSVMHRRSCLEHLTKPYWPEEGNWKEGDAGFFERLAGIWWFYPIQEVLDVKRNHDNNIHGRVNRGMSPIYDSEI